MDEENLVGNVKRQGLRRAEVGGALAPGQAAVGIRVEAHVPAAGLHGGHHRARLVIRLVLVEGEQCQNVVSPQLAERQAQTLLDRPGEQINVHLAGFVQDFGCRVLLGDGVHIRDAAPQAVRGLKIEVGGDTPVRFEVGLEGVIERAELRYHGRFDSRSLVASALGGHVGKGVAQRDGLFLDVTGGAAKPALRSVPRRPQPLSHVHAEAPGVKAPHGGPLRLRGMGNGPEGGDCAGGFRLRHRLGQTGVPRPPGGRVEVGQGNVTVVGLASVEEVLQTVGGGHRWFVAPRLTCGRRRSRE